MIEILLPPVETSFITLVMPECHPAVRYVRRNHVRKTVESAMLSPMANHLFSLLYRFVLNTLFSVETVGPILQQMLMTHSTSFDVTFPCRRHSCHEFCGWSVVVVQSNL